MRTRIILWRVLVVYGMVFILASLAFLFSPTVWSLTPKPEASASAGWNVTPKSGIYANTIIPAFNITTTLTSNESIAVGSPIKTLLVFQTTSEYDKVATVESVSFQFDSKNLSLKFDGKDWSGETVGVYARAGQWQGNFSGVGAAIYPNGEPKYYRVNGTLSTDVNIAQNAISWQTEALAFSSFFGLSAIAVWVVFHNRVKIRSIH